MNDNFTVKIFAPPITDLRCDPCAVAVDMIIKDQEGFYLVEARPPQSIADHQNKLSGWNPDLFFDAENEEKYVTGISGPLPDDHYMVRGGLACELRKSLLKFKSQIQTQVFEPEL